MGWKENLSDLKQLKKRRENEEVAAKQELDRVSQKVTEEYEQAVRILGPKVAKVCKVFAHAIEGKSGSIGLFYCEATHVAEIWSYPDEIIRNVGLPRTRGFEIVTPKSKWKIGHTTIKVPIYTGGVLVCNDFYTKVFFEQLHPVLYSQPLPSLSFFRCKQAIKLGDSHKWWWSA